MTWTGRRLRCVVSLAILTGVPVAAFGAGNATLFGTRSSALSEATDLGKVPDETAISGTRLILKRDTSLQAAFDQLTAAQQDRSSPLYHRWLNPSDIGAEFGPSASAVTQAAEWLRSQGLTVDAISPTGLFITFSGTAASVSAAFHVGVHNFQLRTGRQIMALAADPQIATSLAGTVIGVTGLDGVRPEPLVRPVGPVVRHTDGTWHAASGSPAFTTTINGVEQEDVAPADFDTVYDVTPLRTASRPTLGSSQTIGLVEDSSILTSDWQTFRSTFGLANIADPATKQAASLTIVHPGCNLAGRTGDESEAALDAEWATAVAPTAAIQLAACSDASGGIQASLQGLVDEATHPGVISVSCGECESQLGASAAKAWAALLQQGAAEGISIFVSTGDSGSAGCDQNASIASKGISVNGLASSAYDVAVGGTDFADFVSNTVPTYWNVSGSGAAGSAKSYIPELPWNDTCANPALANYEGSSSTLAFCNTTTGRSFLATGGAGGGASTLFAKPSYQSGVYGIPNDGARDLPDVVLFASNGLFGHALLYCMSDTREGGSPCTYANGTAVEASSAGGTSFAAPAFAGIQALIDQKKSRLQGNPDPRLYAMSINQGNTLGGQCWSAYGAGQPASCVFHDIANGGIDQACSSGSPGCYSAGNTYGLLSTSSTSEADAFNANWGYDLASGLGSVDVKNLVNNY